MQPFRLLVFLNKMLTAVKAGRKEYRKIMELFESSFPPEECMPGRLLQLMAHRKNVDFLAFCSEGKFAGFTYLVHHENMTFVLYLAVDSSIRSKGYGSQMLDWIAENCREIIVLNIETVSREYSDYLQRSRRQHFYLKNGFREAGLRMKYGIVYDVLYRGGDSFSRETYENLLKKFSFGFMKTDWEEYSV